MDHPIYYRLIIGRNDTAVIACLQDFDEYDYNHDHYITNEKFDTEDDARAWAQKTLNHPQCPDYMKPILVPLCVNLDWLYE